VAEIMDRRIGVRKATNDDGARVHFEPGHRRRSGRQGSGTWAWFSPLVRELLPRRGHSLQVASLPSSLLRAMDPADSNGDLDIRQGNHAPVTTPVGGAVVPVHATGNRHGVCL
jgi:hypothetical protein